MHRRERAAMGLGAETGAETQRGDFKKEIWAWRNMGEQETSASLKVSSPVLTAQNIWLPRHHPEAPGPSPGSLSACV